MEQAVNRVCPPCWHWLYRKDEDLRLPFRRVDLGRIPELRGKLASEKKNRKKKGISRDTRWRRRITVALVLPIWSTSRADDEKLRWASSQYGLHVERLRRRNVWRAS
jgi:hypothetical protein